MKKRKTIKCVIEIEIKERIIEILDQKNCYVPKKRETKIIKWQIPSLTTVLTITII